MGFSKRARKRVLVVDDEMLIVAMTCQFLEEAGFEAAHAVSTREALRKMRANPAHLVLLDVQMADEDGLIFLKKLRALYPKVPVVILTGVGYDEAMMQTALQNGARGYISKTIEMENMLHTIKRLIHPPAREHGFLIPTGTARRPSPSSNALGA